ncbi:MAG: BTAD domain-containing putative transcriptional regulator [Gemmatimonadales bacterium]
MFELRILGEIRLSASDGTDRDVLLRQPKRLALLAYLATPTPGTWHRRDTLLALFWPDLDTSHARTSLRNGIYVIRQALGDEVVRNRGDEEISLDPALVRTDLSHVWESLEHHDAETALDHYGGELLRGLYPAGSEGFLRWLDLERTRIKVAVSVAVMASVDEHEREGRLVEALALTRRVQDLQPDDETVVRRMMTLQEAIGDRGGALATFEGYRGRLAQDFDAEPAAETVAMAARLRAATVSPGEKTKRAILPIAGTPVGAEAVDTASPPPQGRVSDHSSRSRWAVVGAILVLGMLAGATRWISTRPTPPLAIGASSPLSADDGLQVEAALSPNGRLVRTPRETRIT